MPKLSPENAKKVGEAEGGTSFEVMPEGKYRARLIDVESTKSSKGSPMWVWKFEVEFPNEHSGRWLWERTAIQENTMWKLNQVFGAFGVPADTDTDDMIGRSVDLMVAQKVAEKGKMAGKLVNEISEFLPASGGGEAAPAAAAPKQTGEEIPF